MARFKPPSDLQLNRGASGSVEHLLFLLWLILVVKALLVVLIVSVALVLFVGVSIVYLVFVLMVVRGGGLGEGLATTAYQLKELGDTSLFFIFFLRIHHHL